MLKTETDFKPLNITLYEKNSIILLIYIIPNNKDIKTKLKKIAVLKINISTLNKINKILINNEFL